MDRFHEGRAQRRVRDLRPGDRVDLQNNEFADPEGFAADGGPGFMSEKCQSNGWAYEFAEVMAVEDEGADCVCVTFVDGFTCGFPPDHSLEIPDYANPN